MIFKKMLKIFIGIIFLLIPSTFLSAQNAEFKLWLNDFKLKAINTGISKKVVNDVMSGASYLPKVIEYDRYQPEFYEDTNTYITKRANSKKVKKGLILYKKEKNN